MNGLMLRRRAIMAQKKEGPNGLLPTDACGIPNTVAYVASDGLLYITYVQAYRYAQPHFKRPLSLITGDVVEIRLRNTGTTSRGFFSNMALGSFEFATNVHVDLRAGRTYSKTITINEGLVVDSFGWAQRTDNISVNLIIEVQILVNGERVI